MRLSSHTFFSYSRGQVTEKGIHSLSLTTLSSAKALNNGNLGSLSIERLLMDDCPDVRVVAVEGCCRILHLFWEIIPSPTITKMLTKVFDEMSHDLCSEIFSSF
ncbi:hypothetical protein SLEP1_g8315 [Rubroshorea leprosula]|uniref:Uncharacterized protein n=1 Tax=Rubroshorea leprosula TaxID=152421 RepID=A0AAV5I9L9_9ROSI|nr:hypothetical protein SLEP1_g8315 [Rubroshorea leprosula]